MPALEIVVVVAVLSFVIGSIPVSRLAYLSKRTVSESRCRTAEILKVLLDIAKGFGVVFFAQLVLPESAFVAATGVFLGHVFPIFRFRLGGNGLGTLLGALSALDPTLGLIALSAWMFGFYVYQQADTAALVSSVATPLATLFLPLSMSTLPLLPVSLLVLCRHKSKMRSILFGDQEGMLAQE